MQRLRRQRPEIPDHGRRFQVGARIALLGMDKVGKLAGVLDEEHRRVVADQIPDALLGIKLDRETAWIALGIGRAFFTADGRKAQEYASSLADAVEQLGLGVARDI